MLSQGTSFFSSVKRTEYFKDSLKNCSSGDVKVYLQIRRNLQPLRHMMGQKTAGCLEQGKFEFTSKPTTDWLSDLSRLLFICKMEVFVGLL